MAMGEPVSAARATDEVLFAELYPTLRRFAAFVAPVALNPDDLVQEAAARALRGGPLSRLEAPAQYLRTAIVRLAANERRRRWRGARADERLGASGSLVEQEVYPSDLAVIDLLVPLDRAILYLTIIDGMSRASAAETLGMSEPALRQRLSRALMSLRRSLEQEEACHG
jgi:DNA-directed RNA polymerase specialized sigma24 family protein